MTMPDLPWDGGCRCGKIRFRVTGLPLMTGVCHCRGCQRMSASAFSTSLMLPADALEIRDGEPVLGGLHGDQSRHHHCGWCKSWLFTRLPPEFGVVNVHATMLDDPRWFVPFMETQTVDKLPWVRIPAQRSFEGFPEPADYAALVRAYNDT